MRGRSAPLPAWPQGCANGEEQVTRGEPRWWRGGGRDARAFRVSTGNADRSRAERVATTESFGGVRNAGGRWSRRSG